MTTATTGEISDIVLDIYRMGYIFAIFPGLVEVFAQCPPIKCIHLQTNQKIRIGRLGPLNEECTIVIDLRTLDFDSKPLLEDSDSLLSW